MEGCFQLPYYVVQCSTSIDMGQVLYIAGGSGMSDNLPLPHGSQPIKTRQYGTRKVNAPEQCYVDCTRETWLGGRVGTATDRYHPPTKQAAYSLALPGQPQTFTVHRNCFPFLFHQRCSATYSSSLYIIRNYILFLMSQNQLSKVYDLFATQEICD